VASLVFQYIYPIFNGRPDLGWRVMFWSGVIPGLLVLWLAKGVKESPVWLDRQKHLKDRQQTEPVSFARLFRGDLLGVTVQTSVLMGAFIFSYHSTSFWYVTYLREAGFKPFWFTIALNAGGIIGAIVWGRAAETRMGRRGAVTAGALMGVVTIPLFLMTVNPPLVFFGALLMGIGGPGMWGVIPTYLAERYSTSARGVGAGFSYHAGAAIGSATPTLIGALKDRGMALASVMSVFIGVSNVLAILLIWAGPETRGKQLEVNEFQTQSIQEETKA
jgi:MFS family permease